MVDTSEIIYVQSPYMAHPLLSPLVTAFVYRGRIKRIVFNIRNLHKVSYTTLYTIP